MQELTTLLIHWNGDFWISRASGTLQFTSSEENTPIGHPILEVGSLAGSAMGARRQTTLACFAPETFPRTLYPTNANS